MTVYAMSREAKLRVAVDQASRAPSIHNTQPWLFVLGHDRLDVLSDPRRQLPVLDQTGRQMIISVGCALLNARVSLASGDVPTWVNRVPDPQRPDLMATVEFGSSGAVDHRLAVLAPMINLRQTNRRRFEDFPVPAEVVETLTSAAASEGARLHELVDPDDRQALARLTQQADTQQITDPAYRAELRSWTTNDPGRRDGVRAAVVPHVDGASGDEVPIRDFDTQGAGWLPAQTQSTTGQCLLVLGTDGDDTQSWLRAGEALERVWLEITRAGLVASLFTQVIEVEALRHRLKDELRLGMWPHVVLRVGQAPITAASLRRNLSEVLEDETQV